MALSELLERRLKLAKDAIRVNTSTIRQLMCWKLVRETALAENNEEWFEKADTIVSLLAKRL